LLACFLQEFYEWINSEDREKGSMQGVTFAVFALGNRQYEHCEKEEEQNTENRGRRRNGTK